MSRWQDLMPGCGGIVLCFDHLAFVSEQGGAKGLMSAGKVGIAQRNLHIMFSISVI